MISKQRGRTVADDESISIENQSNATEATNFLLSPSHPLLLLLPLLQ